MAAPNSASRARNRDPMASPGENLRINPDRLWASIHDLAEIGPGVAGGSNRQTLTDDDAKGRTLFKSWCEGAGMRMGLDQMGTMFARREGTDPSLDPVYIGSHLDTQPPGGRYDGVHGVLNALEEIGVVTLGQGLWWLEFSLTGKEAHTGSTPMNMRVNAGLAMARILEMVQDVAMSEQPGAVGGVGQMRFSPSSRNVLPGTVVFTVDIRSPEQVKLGRMRAKIEAEAPRICEALGVECSVEPVGHFDPVTFDPTLVARVRAAAEKLGYSHMNIISGAGHAACWTNKVAPSTMII